MSNGAFLVAHAGLANHRWLTTHWRDAQRLATEYPLVHVMSNPRCFKDGNLYSSRGVSDGMHVALTLVREDLGGEIAGTITRLLSGSRGRARGSYAADLF